MHMFKVGPFELGMDIDLATAESLDNIFKTLWECPECSASERDLELIEAEVRAKWREVHAA